MSNDENLTVKQQREQRRAAKVANLKAQQAKEKRRNLIGIIAAAVGGVGVLALVITIVIANSTPAPDPSAIEVDGVQVFEGLEATHVPGAVEYEMTPPAGGPHNQTWLNCGIYEEPVPNEYAVHALEHAAVWVTYDPEQVAGDDLETLRDAMPSTYIILSPFEGLDAPVVASAWGVQVALDGVDDPRLEDFIVKYRLGETAPERGALCTQGIDGPGKVA